MSRPPSQPVLRAPRPSHPLAPVPEPALEAPVVQAPVVAVTPAAALTPVEPELVEPAPVEPEPASAPPAGEVMRTFTTRLPVDLRRRLRRHAINTDQTLEQVARAMVVEFLARHEAP